jgi:hypothetical protein
MACLILINSNVFRLSNKHTQTYGCEAWTLTNRDEQYLRIFERRILRKIFGPVQNEDGFWRIRMNHELNDLIKNADIEICKKKKNGLAGSCDAYGRRKNTQKSTGVETNG